jgi:hypothetical protein
VVFTPSISALIYAVLHQPKTCIYSKTAQTMHIFSQFSRRGCHCKVELYRLTSQEFGRVNRFAVQCKLASNEVRARSPAHFTVGRYGTKIPVLLCLHILRKWFPVTCSLHLGLLRSEITCPRILLCPGGLQRTVRTCRIPGYVADRKEVSGASFSTDTTRRSLSTGEMFPRFNRSIL